MKWIIPVDKNVLSISVENIKEIRVLKSGGRFFVTVESESREATLIVLKTEDALQLFKKELIAFFEDDYSHSFNCLEWIEDWGSHA